MTDFYNAGGYNDHFRIARSKVIKGPLAVGTYPCIRIPKGAFVLEVFAEVTDALTTTGTLALTVGFSGNQETADVDAFMTNTEVAGDTAGLKRADIDGKRFKDGSGAITFTVGAGGALTGGEVIIHTVFTHLH